MLNKYFKIEDLQINNSVVTYLIVFFILLPLSYVKDSLPHDFKIFTYKISKIIILLIIILLTITKNTQIAISATIFFIYISIYDNKLSEDFKSAKK